MTNVVACCCTCTLNVHPATKLHSVIDILEQFFFRLFFHFCCGKNSKRIFLFSDRLILVNILSGLSSDMLSLKERKRSKLFDLVLEMFSIFSQIQIGCSLKNWKKPTLCSGDLV